MNLAVVEILVEALEQVLLCVFLVLGLKSSGNIFGYQGHFVELHFLYNCYSLLLVILILISNQVALVNFLI